MNLRSSSSSSLQSRLQSVRPCRAPIWARTAHAQTILGHLIPSPKFAAVSARVELDLGKGEALIGRLCALRDDAEVSKERNGKVLVHLFHGLGGSADADYMERSARVCRGNGWSSVRWNHRGAGDGQGRARSIYHSGISGDLYRAIAWGRREFADHRQIAVGFSLSGNALLLGLSGRAPRAATGNDVDPSLPDGAVAINAPIDLRLCSHTLSEGLNRIYDLRFVRLLRRSADALAKQGGRAAVGVGPFDKLREFDRLYTAREAGFATSEDYYSECSAGRHLHQISIPTWIVTAEDDPFVPIQSYRSARLSPTTRLHIEPVGGHMGYLSSDLHPRYGMRWLDGALEAAIGDVLR